MNNIKLAENTLGQRIKAQRIRMGYTQEKLAELMCVPKPTISSYENDRIDIKGSVIAINPKMINKDIITKKVIAILFLTPFSSNFLSKGYIA